MLSSKTSKVLQSHEENENIAADLGEVPFPILEKIAAKMDPEDMDLPVSEACSQIKEAAYHVILAEYSSLRQDIKALISKVKKEAEDTTVTKDNFEDYLVLVTVFGFLQVMEAEYRALEVILSQQASIIDSVLHFRAINCIDQYCYLIDNYLFLQWNTFTNTNSILKPITALNHEIAAQFFVKVWDITKDPLGLMMVRLLGCSPSSSADLIVSYHSPPAFSNSACCIQGYIPTNFTILRLCGLQHCLASGQGIGGIPRSYQLPDFSVACPPFLPSPEEDFTNYLIRYIWKSVSWANAFHVHRLRWKILETANVDKDEWELLKPGDPYTEESLEIKTRRERTDARGATRTWRAAKKHSEDQVKYHPFGLRFDFKLQCPLFEAPRELFEPEEYAFMTSLPRRPFPARYQFEMDLRSQVCAKRRGHCNIVVASINLQEKPEALTYSFSKNLLF